MKNQKNRSMKVHAQSGYNYKATPTIILKGQWLQEMGFEIGDFISVCCEDGKANIYVKYVFNNFEILEFHPEESWHSGKHMLSLYYPIEHVVPNSTNIFEVYLRIENGTGEVATGDCVSSISGQSMAAAASWDGKIEVEEETTAFRIAGQFRLGNIEESLSVDLMEMVYCNYSDEMQIQHFAAFGEQIEID